jgi:MFS family permease
VPTPDDSAPLFAHRAYVLVLAGRFCGTLATTSQGVVLAWEVYELARATRPVDEAAFLVGMIGLVQFLPLAALTFVAGEAVDRYDRRKIVIGCYVCQFLIATGLAALAAFVGRLEPVFVLAFLFGCARSFFQPAATALGPMLVPTRLLPRAIATNSLAFQLASVLGPALGGLLCAVSPVLAFGVGAGLYATSLTCALCVRANTKPPPVHGKSRLAQIRDGLAYVWGNKLVLGAISLDLFAVLLGGATGLLPVFARDVLEVGPDGFGVLRAAPAVGALAVAAYLAYRPIRSKAGLKMLLAVALFGVATVVFAFSRWVPLSVAALVVVGGADMVSVFTRQTLVLLATPDHVRGRVAAVSTLFIGASNELGEFESGVTARLFGPVGAVAVGGAGAVAVTAVWAWRFPPLRKADKLTTDPLVD